MKSTVVAKQRMSVNAKQFFRIITCIGFDYAKTVFLFYISEECNNVECIGLYSSIKKQYTLIGDTINIFLIIYYYAKGGNNVCIS